MTAEKLLLVRSKNSHRLMLALSHPDAITFVSETKLFVKPSVDQFIIRNSLLGTKSVSVPAKCKTRKIPVCAHLFGVGAPSGGLVAVEAITPGSCLPYLACLYNMGILSLESVRWDIDLS